MKVSWILSMMIAALGFTATAQAEENSCVLIQKLAANLGCVGTTPGAVNSADKNFKDETISNTFGGEACAMSKVLDDAKASQKKECQAWLNTQKKQLGNRYITGACTPSCAPCPDSLQKCSTLGEVRYRLDNRDR